MVNYSKPRSQKKVKVKHILNIHVYKLDSFNMFSVENMRRHLLNMCVYVVDYTPVVMRSNTRYSRDVVVSSDTRICK